MSKEMIFSNQRGGYVERCIRAAEGRTEHIKFSIEPSSTERMMWVCIEVKSKNVIFHAVPVVIRSGQKFGIIFIDCMHVPGTRLCKLRGLTVGFVSRARQLFNQKYGQHVLHKPATLSLKIAVVRTTELVEPPPPVQFHHCCSLCIRYVNQVDSNAYLHLYRNARRCFHPCFPTGLDFGQRREMLAVYQRECISGTNRWGGTHN